MSLPIAKDGYPFIVFFFILFALSFLLSSWILSGILGVLTLFMMSFFRDPSRQIDRDANTIYSPADGKITEIKTVKYDDKDYYQVVIFLSVFNCHINRIPFTGKVRSTTHIPGKFSAAFYKDIEEKNERQVTEFETDKGLMKVVQLTGALARRIVCRLKSRDWVHVGDRFGLIKFGSRTDLYFPQTARILVQKGQKVKGGITPFGRFSD